MIRISGLFLLLYIVIIMANMVACYSYSRGKEATVLRNQEAAKRAASKNDASIHKMRAEKFEDEGYVTNANDEKKWAKDANEESIARDSSIKQ